MKIPWGSEIANRFITNVGLITTYGDHGHNIMACEWTHHLSYDPALVGIALHPRHATHAHIKASKEFGICIASIHQSELSSIAGKGSGKIYNKINIAKELGYDFVSSKKINALMVAGASANLECILHQEIHLGDHTLFVGEVIEGSFTAETKPLGYHAGKYWEMSSSLVKPSEIQRGKINLLFEKYKK